MAVNKRVKKGDTTAWTIKVSDMAGGVIGLSDAGVQFKLRKFEGHSDAFFARDTRGTGSDYIAVSDGGAGGILTVTPRAADWNDVSDYGIYVGEFRVSDAGTVKFSQDYVIDVQEVLI